MPMSKRGLVLPAVLPVLQSGWGHCATTSARGGDRHRTITRWPRRGPGGRWRAWRGVSEE